MKQVLIIGLVCFFLSCEVEQQTYTTINPELSFEKPSNFPEPIQDVGVGVFTQKGFELGRKLFYENRLSKDNSVSCAFCHEQEFAFTHHGHVFSHGIDGKEGNRNSPAIQNLAFYSDFFHDGAVPVMNKISIAPITNPVEMDETPQTIAEKLQGDVEYISLFSEAFDDGQVSSYNLLNALNQFLGLMISSNSKYDKYVRGEEGVTFSEQEEKGLEIFKNKCATCHATDIFTDNSFRNNGLAPNPKFNDLGRENVTGYPEDRYKFKVPSLRNVEKTAPYMHDGRFGSLESVLNFYNSQVQQSETLDSSLQDGDHLGIPLSDQEQKELIGFLKTLTDYEFLSNPIFYQKT